MSLKQLILAATVATSALSAQASNTFKPEEISRSDPRFSGICEQVSKNAIDIIEWKNACEVSTDGGKTWIKAAGGASILAAIGVGALIRIRKRKEEKGEEKLDPKKEKYDGEIPFPKDDGTDPDIDNVAPDNDETLDTTHDDIDPVAEADVYTSYGHYGKAIELLQEELKKNPENTNAYLKLAEAYKQMKEDAKVVTDKNPTLKDSELLRAISKFESSLSESELRKLIEAGNPEDQSTTETPKTGENIDLGPDTIVPEITESTTEIVPPIEEVVIVHEEIKPSAVTISENILPVKVAEPENIPKKQNTIPLMDKPLRLQLKRRGFEIIEDTEAGNLHVKTIREGSYLTVLDENEQGIKTIGYNEIFTVNSLTLNTFLDLSGKKPRMKLEQKNHKTLYVEIIGNVIF